MQDARDRAAYSLLRESSEDLRTDTPSGPPHHKRGLFLASTYVNITLLVINITVAIFLLHRITTLEATSYLIYSPLNELVQTQKDYWNLTLGQRTAFTEAPSKEVDALWDSITAPPGQVGSIKVSRHDLERNGLESVQVADGSGYLATVDVFHQLHCLDLLRKHVFNATYEISPIQNPLWEDHIAHCIDSIRLSLQCSADVSLITWKWVKGYANPWPDFRSKHECRNWDDILGWARREVYDLKTPGTLVHPELGPIDDLDGSWFQNPLRDGRAIEYVDTS